MGWLETSLSLPFWGSILKRIGMLPISKIRRRFRDLLQQRIKIEEGMEGSVYEGYSYKPLAFHVKLDSKAFDDVRIESVDCVFLYEDVPLQRMQWNKGDKWASNCTEPHVPDKLAAFGSQTLTLLLNSVILFSLWAEMEEIDRKRLLHSHEFGSSSVRAEFLSFPEARDA